MASLTGKEFSVYRPKEGKVIADTVTIPEPGPHDVIIRITHSGVCYTDYEFFRFNAPLALGHEGVGIVEAIGSAVTSLKLGDRVGGGFHNDSCGQCNYCTTGQDIWCAKRTIFGFGGYNNGTFGAYFVGKEGYVHKIPDGLTSADAAPLQCAGATVYTALVDTLKPRHRVGIIGIGGLGHLAIQYAAKLGAEVVVFSTSKDKEQEAPGFGASEFVLLSEPESVKAPVDILVLTGSKYPDWSKFLNTNVLARRGTVIPLAAPTQGPLTLPADKLFWDGYQIQSTLVASKAQHNDMLEFSARHGIKPTIQVYKFNGPETIESVFDKLKDGKVRYRAVLEF
ncbi:chaperonin 10-like protein [Cercophora newfieldiana]|uniref:Chaperonin 10-like protein n=1 Tax=Cercophora newfieldiana TaxID=92897 RepID=A0AA39Y6P1_9PEZI|nr:chaperonin 10-like protein [Cercophora newfieldiana]